MTGFALKLTALLTMLIDHSTFVLYIEGHMSLNLYYILRGIGRLAFPIYCFLLVQGFQNTRDRGKYIRRLMEFALISQLPFTLCFFQGNHYGVMWGRPAIHFSGLPLILICALFLLLVYLNSGSRKPGDYITPALFILLPGLRLTMGSVTLLDGHMNVFYTLTLGLAVICLVDADTRRALPQIRCILAAAALAGALIFIQRDADYGLMGIGLIFLLYALRDSRLFSALGICLWAFLQYGFQGADLLFAICASLSIVPVFLYNGRRGPSAKYFFYGFYPIHLALLGLISFII